MTPPCPRVAVIDIGSNSIKALIAQRDARGDVAPIQARTIEARISAGMGKAEPRLSDEGMARGVAAIRELLAVAAEFTPARTALVATSAVREARNSGEFSARVRAATGHEIRILSGTEEANLIGRGLTCDPALRDLRDFLMFDLGGGSLECLAFQNRTIERAASLPLGCVRLTERFVADVNAPLAKAAESRVAEHVRACFDLAGITIPQGETRSVIATGGSIITARAILAARGGRTFDESDPILTVAQLKALLDGLGALPLAERKQVAGLPPARADVFPVALATFVAIADFGGFSAYRTSLYNLRYGLADEALGGTEGGAA